MSVTHREEKETIRYEKYGSQVHVLTTVEGALVGRVRSQANVIFTEGGRFYEGGVPAGTSHFMEHVIANSIKGMTPEAFKTMCNRKRVQTDASTDELTVVLQAQGHVSHAKDVWEIVRNMSFYPELMDRAKLIEQERQRILSELIYRSNPNVNVKREVARQIYAEGCFRLVDVAGTPESIASITPDDLTRRYAQIRANGHIIIAVSNINEPERKSIAKIAEKLAQENSGITSQTAVNGIPPLQLADFIYLPLQHPKADEETEFSLYIPAPYSLNEVAARDFVTSYILQAEQGLNGFLQHKHGLYSIKLSYDKPLQYYGIHMRVSKDIIVPTAESMMEYIADPNLIEAWFTPAVFRDLKAAFIEQSELQFDTIQYQIGYSLNGLLSQGILLTPRDYIEAIHKLRYNDILAWLEKIRMGLSTSRMVAVSNSSTPEELKEPLLGMRANVLAKL